jgi:hypothetical protein
MIDLWTWKIQITTASCQFSIAVRSETDRFRDAELELQQSSSREKISRSEFQQNEPELADLKPGRQESDLLKKQNLITPRTIKASKHMFGH